MRTTRGVVALALVAALAAACSGGGAASPSAAPATAAPATQAPASEAPATEAPATEAPSVEPSPSADACAPETLPLLTPGTLTMGADNPAFPPYFEPSETNPEPWEIGDPTNGQGFEGAVAAAFAREMGFTPETTTWVPVPFLTAIGPGDKDFDVYLTQVSWSAERAEAVDLTDGYSNIAQAVVAAKDSPLASVTTISGLKDFVFGAQVGTTSLATITDVIAPTKEPKVYDTNDLAVKALRNGQIDGLVVDLPTTFFVTAVQFPKGVIVGQFPTVGEQEHFSMVLDKDSPLTACANAAIGRLQASGELAAIEQEWIADKANAPVFQP
jgi:polar amino acid transport system substrate-binding protein